MRRNGPPSADATTADGNQIMFQLKILPATVAAMLALGVAGSAYADGGEHENRHEIAAALAAKTSIAQAIAAAEKQAGGNAMKVGMEKEHGAYVYKVRTVSKKKVTDLFIDPATGAVVRREDEGLIAKIFDDEDQDEFARLAKSPTTLAEAVAAGEKKVGGKAIEARFETRHHATRFEVEIARNDAVSKVMIDGVTGKVVKIYKTEDGEHGED